MSLTISCSKSMRTAFIPPSGPSFARSCAPASVVGCVGGCELDHILLPPCALIRDSQPKQPMSMMFMLARTESMSKHRLRSERPHCHHQRLA
eukprot:1411440-Heterocapsa_arctica.AAC.2